MMKTRVGYKQLLEEAEKNITSLSVDEALALHREGKAKFLDIRDIREIERDGSIPGAIHCPRGMLEFWIDPESPYHRPVFAGPHYFVFYCAAGCRSALATQTAQMMGLSPVAHIKGGFGAWKEKNGPVEAYEREGARSTSKWLG